METFVFKDWEFINISLWQGYHVLVEISQNFVAFSEYMNLMTWIDAKDVTKLKAWQIKDENLMTMTTTKPFFGPPETSLQSKITLDR